MVGGKQKTTRQDNNSVELEVSLAPAEAEVGAVAKADQKQRNVSRRPAFNFWQRQPQFCIC